MVRMRSSYFISKQTEPIQLLIKTPTLTAASAHLVTLNPRQKWFVRDNLTLPLPRILELTTQGTLYQSTHPIPRPAFHTNSHVSLYVKQPQTVPKKENDLRTATRPVRPTTRRAPFARKLTRLKRVPASET